MYVVLVAFEGGEEVLEPVVSMARDWLNAWDVMFWILENEWFSYQGHPGLEKGGVSEYSRYVEESSDAVIVDEQSWEIAAVPATEALPYVDGESWV